MALYEGIASEYYDIQRHPTCRNFLQASRVFIEQNTSAQRSGVCADIGAGRSIVCSLFGERGLGLESVVLVDSSMSMLNYSMEYKLKGAKLVVADATALPLKKESVSLMIASLGDPYNTSEFWREVVRCLAHDGLCIFTTPSHEWAEAFRTANKKERNGWAYFELRDGRSLYLPSHIHPIKEQIELIEDNGLDVVHVHAVPGSVISEPISSKLIKRSGLVSSPVTGFCVIKGR